MTLLGWPTWNRCEESPILIGASGTKGMGQREGPVGAVKRALAPFQARPLLSVSSSSGEVGRAVGRSVSGFALDRRAPHSFNRHSLARSASLRLGGERAGRPAAWASAGRLSPSLDRPDAPSQANADTIRTGMPASRRPRRPNRTHAARQVEGGEGRGRAGKGGAPAGRPKVDSLKARS